MRTANIFQMGIFLFMELGGYMFSVSETLALKFSFHDIYDVMLYV